MGEIFGSNQNVCFLAPVKLTAYGLSLEKAIATVIFKLVVAKIVTAPIPGIYSLYHSLFLK